MVVAIRISPPVKGRAPKLSMLELVTEVNSRYRNSKLRKKVLPQGFCYVCSRLDPSGIFRNQNSYLFQRGFFHACEHFPHAPQSTFVGGEIKIDLNRNETSTVTETVAPSISVKIKHETDSAKLGTSPRREKTTISSRETIKNDPVKGTPSVKYSSRNSRFPPIASSLKTENFTDSKGKPDLRSVSRIDTPFRAKTFSSIELQSSGTKSRRSGLTKTASSAREINTFSNVETDRITIIPTAQEDDVSKSDEKSDLSTTPGVTEKQTITSDKDIDTTTVGGATKDNNTETTPYINKSDGLGSVFSVEPLIKEVFLFDGGRHGSNQKRQTGGRGSERNYGTDTETDTDRHGSGHLRYHHRSDEDSVPDPGFEIPPTPSVEERLQLEREEQSRKEAERKELERLGASGNVLVEESMDGDYLESLSDDTSLRFTEARSAKTSRHQMRPTLSSTSRKSFCRCPSDTRESSFMKSTCLICGKEIIYGNARRSRESSISQNEAAGTSMRSPSSVSNRSRQQMLDKAIERVKSKGKSVSDEDYMDLESIIYEDDGRYWSSDEDDYHTQYMTRSAMLRYRNAKPFPLVDPNLHKLAYIRALREARLRSEMDSEDEFDPIEKLRHPHTFSYFPLLANFKTQNGGQSNIGLRASDDAVYIKQGQFMRHIFGDIHPDEFIPKSTKRVRKHSILDITDTALLSTDHVTTDPTDSSPRTMANIQREDERTSVSLKMRKSGVNFENGP